MGDDTATSDRGCECGRPGDIAPETARQCCETTPGQRVVDDSRTRPPIGAWPVAAARFHRARSADRSHRGSEVN